MNKGLSLTCLTMLLVTTTGCSTSEQEKKETTKNSSSKEISMNSPVKPGDVLPLEQFSQKDGIAYYITKPGSDKKTYSGDSVEVHYSGYLFDPNTKTVGTKFDSSKDRGQTFSFVLNGNMVIKGWDLSLADMTIGEHRTIILPPELGYGKYGAGRVIPANATLLFEVELIGVQ